MSLVCVNTQVTPCIVILLSTVYSYTMCITNTVVCAVRASILYLSTVASGTTSVFCFVAGYTLHRGGGSGCVDL